MTSRQGDHLRITSLSWGESTDDRCIPLTRRLRCGALMLYLLLAWTSCWKKQQICGNLRCPDTQAIMMMLLLDDVIKWKHFPRNWPFVRGIHRSRWFPRTKASDAELWCFFYLRLNKRLSKQSWGWWFETLSWSLWGHCNALKPSWWCCENIASSNLC